MMMVALHKSKAENDSIKANVGKYDALGNARLFTNQFIQDRGRFDGFNLIVICHYDFSLHYKGKVREY